MHIYIILCWIQGTHKLSLAVEMEDDVLLPSAAVSSSGKSGLSKMSSTNASSSSCIYMHDWLVECIQQFHVISQIRNKNHNYPVFNLFDIGDCESSMKYH